MSKTSAMSRPPRRPSARARLAAERAARQRAAKRRRLLIALGSVTAVVATVATFVTVSLTTSPAHLTASADQSGSVPFLDIGNRHILAGAQFDPQVLAGLSAAQIAAQLRDPSSPVAQAIDGSANVIVAAINQVLHDQASQG